MLINDKFKYSDFEDKASCYRRGDLKNKTSKQRFTTFLAPGTGFMEDNFSVDQSAGGGEGEIVQAYCFIVYFISIIIASSPP